MANSHVLPDSRLSHRPDFGSQMVDWPMPDGSTVRCEAVNIYCANCGKLYGWVPKDNTAFAFWLCRKCFEVFGEQAGFMAVPEEEFNKTVQYEMEQRFGRCLTDQEILFYAERGELGTALEKLEKESPYPVPSR